jgi:tetratricopeptide (TPR) repeat protein
VAVLSVLEIHCTMMSGKLRSGLAIAAALASAGLAFAQAGSQTNNDDAASQYAAAGQQALAAGDYAAAQTNFENLAKLEPGVAEIHANLAAIYYKQREYDLAVREIHTAQKLKPSLGKLDSLLGMSLAEEGRLTEALPGLQKGFKQSADTEVRRMCGLQLMRAYTGLNRDTDAVETALALNRFYPDDPEVLYHTGRIYGNLAYVVMEKLHDAAPGSIWMLQAQSEAYESQKDYDSAIAAYNHILALDSRRPGIHYRLGRVYQKRLEETHKPEDLEAAVREFAAELALDPGNGNAGYELAYIQADKGNLEEARKDYEQVVSRFPDFEEALVGLGGIYLGMEKPELAVGPLDRATHVRPDDKVAWYRLAEAARGTGNKEVLQRAMARFQELRKTNPDGAAKPQTAEEVTPQKMAPDAKP